MGVGLTKATLTFSSKIKDSAITINQQANKKSYISQIDALQALDSRQNEMTGNHNLLNVGDKVAGKDKKDLDGLYGTDANFLYGDEATKTLTFQFNPSTLRISGYGGGMTTIAKYNKDDKKKSNGSESQIEYGALPANIAVDFKVIFDAETNTDAFMRDRYNVNASNLSKEAVGLATGDSWLGENTYVRQIVEGFLATLRNARYRKVTFTWNHLQYFGDLNSVQCNYTMFNRKGEPIRAEVGLRISATGQQDGNGYTRIWKERYEELIKAVDEKGSSSLAGNWFGDSQAFNPISW